MRERERERERTHEWDSQALQIINNHMVQLAPVVVPNFELFLLTRIRVIESGACKPPYEIRGHPLMQLGEPAVPGQRRLGMRLYGNGRDIRARLHQALQRNGDVDHKIELALVFGTRLEVAIDCSSDNQSCTNRTLAHCTINQSRLQCSVQWHTYHWRPPRHPECAGNRPSSLAHRQRHSPFVRQPWRGSQHALLAAG